jgi:hypothetical protein
LHAKNETSPVVPDVADTVPLPGLFKFGEHGAAIHSGSAVLQLPDGKHTDASEWLSTNPNAHVYTTTSPVVPPAALMEPLPGTTKAAHGKGAHNGSKELHEPEVKQTDGFA